MLHAVEANKRASSTETSLTMDGDCSWFALSGRQELGHNLIRGCCTIQEVQVQVFDALLREFGLLVLGLVKAHDECHTHALENWNVVVRGERAVSICHVQGAGEGHEFAGNNPVQIAVLNLLEVLIFLDVKSAVVIPAEGHGELEALEAVQVGATVGTVAHSSITVRNELVVVGAESGPGVISRLFEHDDHEGAHEEGSVALLGVVEGGVVVDLVVLVLLVVHKFLKFLAEQVHLAQVERAKVSEKRLVNKVVVDAEVEGVLPRLGWVLVADPVQSPRDDLHRLVRVATAFGNSCHRRF